MEFFLIAFAGFGRIFLEILAVVFLVAAVVLMIVGKKSEKPEKLKKASKICFILTAVFVVAYIVCAVSLELLS